MIKNVKHEERYDQLYFVIDKIFNGKSKFVECVISFDEEKDKYIIEANDSIVGEI